MSNNKAKHGKTLGEFVTEFMAFSILGGMAGVTLVALDQFRQMVTGVPFGIGVVILAFAGALAVRRREARGFLPVAVWAAGIGTAKILFPYVPDNPKMAQVMQGLETLVPWMFVVACLLALMINAMTPSTHETTSTQR